MLEVAGVLKTWGVDEFIACDWTCCLCVQGLANESPWRADKRERHFPGFARTPQVRAGLAWRHCTRVLAQLLYFIWKEEILCVFQMTLKAFHCCFFYKVPDVQILFMVVRMLCEEPFFTHHDCNTLFAVQALHFAILARYSIHQLFSFFISDFKHLSHAHTWKYIAHLTEASCFFSVLLRAGLVQLACYHTGWTAGRLQLN